MSIEKAILEELNEIKKGFKDAEDMDGYDLANEKFHLLNAIALVKKLTIPVVVFSEAELKAKLEEQLEETRQWLIGEDFEGLAERL
jgi:hypothetical protein